MIVVRRLDVHPSTFEMQCNARDTLPEIIKWEAVGNLPNFRVGKTHDLTPLNGAPHDIFLRPCHVLICGFVTSARIRALFPPIQSLSNRVNRGVMMLLLSIQRFPRARISHPAVEASARVGDIKNTGEKETSDNGDY